MSAFGGKADVNHYASEGPLLAISGHWAKPPSLFAGARPPGKLAGHGSHTGSHGHGLRRRVNIGTGEIVETADADEGNRTLSNVIVDRGGKQADARGDPAAVEFQFQASVEIDPQRPRFQAHPQLTRI